MKKFLLLTNLFFLLLINSCSKVVKSEKGSIDLISNVYFNASKTLDKVRNFHLSSMNYNGDELIEIVPDPSFPENTSKIFYVTDSICYSLPVDHAGSINLSDLTAKKNHLLSKNKKEGALFSDENIPNYKNRKNLTDTVLFKKKL